MEVGLGKNDKNETKAKPRRLPFTDTDSYRNIKVATETFSPTVKREGNPKPKHGGAKDAKT